MPVALYTGSRHDAVLRLRWLPSVDAGWVDLEQGLIYRKGAGESQSSKRRPPVPISPRLAAHLRRWKEIDTLGHEINRLDAKQPRIEINVISYGGLPIAKMRRAWKTACKKSGVDANPHDLRRTFASWAMQAGHSCAKIAAALGTTEKIVEDVYGHLSPDRLRDVVASVAGKMR